MVNKPILSDEEYASLKNLSSDCAENIESDENVENIDNIEDIFKNAESMSKNVENIEKEAITEDIVNVDSIENIENAEILDENSEIDIIVPHNELNAPKESNEKSLSDINENNNDIEESQQEENVDSLANNETAEDENNSESVENEEVIEGKEKKAGTKKERGLSKKARNIIIAVVVAIVVLTASIVTPILVLNKGKIFVNEAEDLLKTKGDIYVINKDITFDGDLVLSKDINLKGKHLNINGTMTLDITLPQMNVGTLKKGAFL